MLRHVRAWAASLSALALILPSVSPGAAFTTVTFTSTADFDAGKVDPGTEYITDQGIDAPFYSVLSQPSAMYFNGRTYVTYTSSGLYLPNVTYYDHASGSWATPVAARESNPNVGDGHSAPSMYITPDGYIHIFCCSHFSTIFHRRSAQPQDISSWVDMPNVTTLATYPSSFYYANRLYFLYRGGPSCCDSPVSWRWRYTTDGGATWTAPTEFINLGANATGIFRGLYVNHFTLSGSKLWYSFVHVNPDAITVGLRQDVYVAYWDLTTNKQHSVSGVDLGASVNLTEADTYAKAVDVPHVWFTSAKLYNSNPYVLYNEGNEDYYFSGLYNGTAKFVRWTGSAWTAPVNITTTDEASNYLNSIATGDLIEAFITASGNTGIIEGAPPGCLCEGWRYSGDLERWTWTPAGGWVFDQTIMTEARGNGPVNFPVVPQDYQTDLRLLFAQFGKDITIADSKVYAWGAGGILPNRLVPSGTWGVETVTDTVMPADAFRSASTISEKFSKNHTTPGSWKFNYYNTDPPDIVCSPAEVSGGKLRLGWAGSGAQGCFMESSWTTDAADWTLTFNSKITITVAAGGIDQFVYALSQPDRGDAVEGFQGTTNGVAFSLNPLATLLRWYTMEDGDLVLQGSAILNCVDVLCYYRIIHDQSSADYTFQTSFNGVSWTTHEVVAAPNQAKWYFIFGAGGAGADLDWDVAFDDWTLVGTVLDGFRTSGADWISPVQAFMTEVADTITVEYVNASAQGFIDSLAIVNSAGAVLWEYGIDTTIGTTVTVAIPHTFALDQALSVDWSVRVRLGSDGTYSAVVTLVTATTKLPLTIQDFELAALVTMVQSVVYVLLALIPFIIILWIILLIIDRMGKWLKW